MSTIVETASETGASTNFKVSVIYNGLPKPVEANPRELVKTLLERAIRVFGSLPNPHTLSLFTQEGQELRDDVRVAESGIKPGSRLLLRPGAVKGGGR